MSVSSLHFAEAIELFQVFDLAAFPSCAEYQFAFAVSIWLAEHLRVRTVAATVTPHPPKQHAFNHVLEIALHPKLVRSRRIATHFLEGIEEIDGKLQLDGTVPAGTS
jgi:hypothetical protein